MNINIQRALARIVLLAILMLAQRTSAEESKVTLLEPGAEPRVTLAFKPAKELNQLSRLTIKSSKEQVSGAGERMSMNMPALTLELGCQVNELDEAGKAKVIETLHRSAVNGGADSDPNQVEMFRQTYAQLEGMKSEAEIKSTGERVTTDATANPTGGGNVGDVTASFAMILPTEPVGVGAKWDVDSNVDQQGLKLSMKFTYEVVALEGDKISVKIVMDGESPSQELALPNLPPGAKAELLSAGLSGEGTADYDLSRLLPIKADQTISNNTRIKIINGAELIEFEQIIKVDQVIEDINELSPKSEAPALIEKPAAGAPKSAAPAKPKAGKKKPKTAPK